MVLSSFIFWNTHGIPYYVFIIHDFAQEYKSDLCSFV